MRAWAWTPGKKEKELSPGQRSKTLTVGIDSTTGDEKQVISRLDEDGYCSVVVRDIDGCEVLRWRADLSRPVPRDR